MLLAAPSAGPRVSNQAWSSAFGFDEPDVAVVAPVDDSGAAAVGVVEEEELVPEQLHLQHGLLLGHGLQDEALALDDRRQAGGGTALPIVLVLVSPGGHLGLGAFVGAVVLGHQPALQAVELVLELVDRPVDGGVAVGGE